MNKCFKIHLLFLLLIVCLNGICSDSAYICIRWNGPSDKPHHEFLFYKKGWARPEQEVPSKNFFVLECVLSDKEFQELKEILFFKINKEDSVDRKDPLFMSYYVGYFEGSNWLLTHLINSEAGFIEVSKKVMQFFKGTQYEDDVKRRWEYVFNRLGIKSKFN